MQVKAKAKYIRISPRKARLVADVVRGLDVTEAYNRLAVTNKKSVKFVKKLLDSALANAKHNYELAEDNLYIKSIRVDDGPILYRWMPRAYGRATPLRKRTAIIEVVLAEKKETKVKTTEQKSEKPEMKTVKVENKEDADIKEDINPEEAQKDKIKRKKKGANTKREKGVLNKVFRRKSGM